ncbi:hypothetical protein QWE_05828 [Agrobacterium albertimagni AOL15]|uniref:Transmembrane protein n=1 Tax=Agrobacterium albertimagni AOL15 TaxID=1156935 RepID=K2QHG9_9HYPH|nr:hypothetical protein [Agrobacterium albertimagni]EKF60561.1 hypothetical protein QWE_05828 [Agrobacterium albertimagni AOL15]
MSGGGNDEKDGAPATPEQRPAIIFWACMGSAGWLLVTGLFVYLSPLPSDCAGPIRCMTLNEWGDFVAGVSAPLAFLWLVVAVFIQSKELSEQRAELRLTRREFELNRDVMKAQAEDAKQQAAYIGQQTALMTKGATESERKQKEQVLETTLEELGSTIRQHLHMQPVILGSGKNNSFQPAVFQTRSQDNEDFILRFADFLNGISSTGVKPPHFVNPRHKVEMMKAYLLAEEARRLAADLKGHSQSRIDRLRVPEIVSIFHSVFLDMHVDVSSAGEAVASAEFKAPWAPGLADDTDANI